MTLVEIDEDHCATCWADGVQVATGCTLGKGNIRKLNYGKWGLTLIDKKTQRSVRVVPKTDAMMKNKQSKFMELRSSGIPASQIAAEVVDPLVQMVSSAPDEMLLNVGPVQPHAWKDAPHTFESVVCSDVRFHHGAHHRRRRGSVHPDSRVPGAGHRPPHGHGHCATPQRPCHGLRLPAFRAGRVGGVPHRAAHAPGGHRALAPGSLHERLCARAAPKVALRRLPSLRRDDDALLPRQTQGRAALLEPPRRVWRMGRWGGGLSGRPPGRRRRQLHRPRAGVCGSGSIPRRPRPLRRSS